MAEEEERIEVIAILRDELSRPADKAADKIERLGDEAEDTERDLKGMGDQADETAEKVDGLTESVKDNTEELQNNAHWQKQNRDERGRFIKNTDASTKATEKNTRAFRGFFKVSLKIDRLFRLFKWGLMIDGALGLGGALTGLGAAAVAAVAGLAPLTGVLGAYPGLLSAGIQGMGTWRIATRGLADAIQVMNDPTATAKELRQALKGMSREQVLFARAIADTKEETTELRKEVSAAFFSGLDRRVDQLGRMYFPVLNRELSATARNLNDVFHYTADWLSQERQMRNIEQIMASQAYIVGELGTGGSAFGRGFLWMLRAAQPMLRMMSRDFHSLGEDFADWTQGNQKRLRRFFKNSYEQFKDVMDVLGDFGMGLYNIGKEADVMSDFLGDSFTDLGKDFREWTESTEGKRSIRQFFEDMIPVVQEMGYWVRDISKMLMGITLGPEFLDMSRELRTNTLPLLGEFLNKTSGKFLPILNDLLRLLNKMADAGLLDSLATVIDGTLEIVDTLVDGLEKLPDPLQEFVATLLTVGAALKFSGFIVGGGRGARGKGSGGGGFFGWRSKGGATGDLPGKHRAGGPSRFSRLKGAGGKAGLLTLLAGGAVASGSNGPMGAAAGGAMMGSILGPWGALAGGAGAGAFSEFSQMWRTPNAAKARNASDIFQKLQASDVGKYAKDLGINVRKLAESVAIYGEDSKMLVDLQDRLNKIDQNVGSELFEFLTPMWQSKQTKAQNALQDLLGVTKGLDGAMQDTDKSTRDALDQVSRLNRNLDMLDGKRVSPSVVMSITRVRTPGGGWATDRGDSFGSGPGFFKGGTPTPGVMSLVGEMGPEAHVDRLGNIRMVGMGGPEFRKFSSGAIIPASATADPFNGETGNAPDWAMDALRKAAGGGDGSTFARNRSSAAESDSAAYSGPLVNIENITASADVDVEGAVLRAIRKAEREKAERS